MTTSLKDLEGGVSNCCDAKAYNNICSDCKEPCDMLDEDFDEYPAQKEASEFFDKVLPKFEIDAKIEIPERGTAQRTINKIIWGDSKLNPNK